MEFFVPVRDAYVADRLRDDPEPHRMEVYPGDGTNFPGFPIETHPNYRIDRILFREIIGTITDAFYLRPHASLTLVEHPSGRLKLSLAGIFSMALEASSTPGNDALLGLELDPTLSYENDEGWSIVAGYAVLFPFGGLSNPDLGLDAQPAQLFRLSLWVTL